MASFVTHDAWGPPIPQYTQGELIESTQKKKKAKTATTVIAPDAKKAAEYMQNTAWMQTPFTLEHALVVFPEMKRPSRDAMMCIGTLLYDTVVANTKAILTARSSSKPSYKDFKDIMDTLLKPYMHRVHYNL